MQARYLLVFISALFLHAQCSGQKQKNKVKTSASTAQSSVIIPAADRLEEYLPLLRGKKVAMLVNHTSLVGKTHIVDTLMKLGINIKIV